MKSAARQLWRGGVGEYFAFIRQLLSAFADWRTHTATTEQRMARGYDINAQSAAAVSSISASVSLEQYFGDSVDLFGARTGYHNLSR